MIVDESRRYIRAIDSEKNVVTFALSGKESTGDPELAPDATDLLGHSVDSRSRVTVEAAETANVHVEVIHIDDDQTETVNIGETKLLGPDTVCQLESTIRVLCRPHDAATVSRTSSSVVIESSDGTVDLDLGWVSLVDRPDATISVHPSAKGIAKYLTTVGRELSTIESPDRSWPSVRHHPPLLDLDDDATKAGVPESLSGIEIAVPSERALEYVMPLSTLCVYLGASLRIEQRDSAVVRGSHWSLTLGDSPEDADRHASDLLSTVFYLDCFARSAGPHGHELTGSVLDDVGLDPETLYDASLDERVRRYRLVDEFELPRWHLGVHINPSVNRARALPELLDRLSDIYLPGSDDLTVADRVDWCREQRFAGAADGGVPVVDPVDRGAETVGWMAPERALGAFNMSISACESCRSDPRGSRRRVAVVDNTPQVEDRDVDVADHYERDGIDVDVRCGVETGELARIVETPHDVIHYVGHHDGDGLSCPDGSLSMTSVAESNARTFFLNAVGSCAQGRILVERGSVAGVVCVEQTDRDSAVSVGADWSRLVTWGWSVERALDTARRATHSPSSFVTVGFGPHVVTQSDSTIPPRVILEDGEVRVDNRGPCRPGLESSGVVDDTPRLSATTRTVDTADADVDALVDRLDSPIVRDGSLVWD